MATKYDTPVKVSIATNDANDLSTIARACMTEINAINRIIKRAKGEVAHAYWSDIRSEVFKIKKLIDVNYETEASK